jgi:hypothetical protein
VGAPSNLVVCVCCQLRSTGLAELGLVISCCQRAASILLLAFGSILIGARASHICMSKAPDQADLLLC